MIAGGTAPILVIGLGCRLGCSVDELLALIEQSLGQAGIALQSIHALASIDLKRDEAGLIQLAAQLKLQLEVFSSRQLAPFASQLSQQSARAFEATGCFGIAESAALALAEQLGGAAARLLITRKNSSGATFALACIG